MRFLLRRFACANARLTCFSLPGLKQAYERALLRSLFEYVRAGELDLAIDMCRQSDQSWRAASLSGGKLWDDPALSGNNDWDDNGMEGVEEKRAKGCKNRRQWKKMCRAIAATVSPGSLLDFASFAS